MGLSPKGPTPEGASVEEQAIVAHSGRGNPADVVRPGAWRVGPFHGSLMMLVVGERVQTGQLAPQPVGWVSLARNVLALECAPRESFSSKVEEA